MVRLLTCEQAHSETCTCTADQNFSVAGGNKDGGEGGDAPVQSADRHTPQPQNGVE